MVCDMWELVERPVSSVKKIGVGAIHELPLQVSRKTTQSESATPKSANSFTLGGRQI